MAQEKRHISVLLLMLKKNYNGSFRNKFKHAPGLCSAIYSLNLYQTVDFSEYFILKEYLKDNRPRGIICEFKIAFTGYWYAKKDFKSRNEWLDKHIKLNTK
jgi:hypothetical protein